MFLDNLFLLSSTLFFKNSGYVSLCSTCFLTYELDLDLDLDFDLFYLYLCFLYLSKDLELEFERDLPILFISTNIILFSVKI